MTSINWSTLQPSAIARSDFSKWCVARSVQAGRATAHRSTAPTGARSVTSGLLASRASSQPRPANLADCMSYAYARAYRVPLLSAGGDFSQPDIEIA
jgi:ribonuclease VapC